VGNDRPDRDEIVDLLIRYATAIDTRDWALFRTCFTADCETDYGTIGAWSGIDALTDFMERTHAPMGQTLHRITNPVVEVDGNFATARSYVQMVVAAARDSTLPFQAFGLYDDHLRRGTDGWRIANRTFTIVASDDPSALRF
jgi:3-phenylpropionate/cinnamic acid dioxygenase small subunit